jgi:hypothetical protein
MKKLFSSNESAEVELLKNIVEKEDIPCTIQTASGAIPFTEYYPELWVMNDEDYPRAKLLLDDWLKPPAPPGEPWKCPICGEMIEAQFSTCWKCAPQGRGPADMSNIA